MVRVILNINVGTLNYPYDTPLIEPVLPGMLPENCNADARAKKISIGKKIEQPVKMNDWADEIFGTSEPLSAKKGKKSLSFIIIVKTSRPC